MSDADPQTDIVLGLAEEFLDRFRKGELTPLRDGLTAIGLAWGQPARAVVRAPGLAVEGQEVPGIKAQ